jgi:hypothetical protein
MIRNLRASGLASAVAIYALLLNALLVGFVACPNTALAAVGSGTVICHESGPVAAPDGAPGSGDHHADLGCCGVYCFGHATFDLPQRPALPPEPERIAGSHLLIPADCDRPAAFAGRLAQPRGPPAAA